MDEALRNFIRNRANFCCEYCSLPEEATPYLTFHIEHVIARQHVVNDSLDNLALACDRCNAYKGPNLSSIDPETMAIVELFHPRIDRWTEHFELINGVVHGLSAKGRATIKLLNMNAARRVQLRQEFI